MARQGETNLMGHHYEIYQRTLNEAARARDVAMAKAAAGSIPARAEDEMRRLRERTETARRRAALAGGAMEALRRAESAREELGALEHDCAAATAELETLEQLIATYAEEAKPLLARAEDLARIGRDVQDAANKALAQVKALDAEAASHREGREGAESSLPFERQAREALEARAGPAEREAAQALARVQAAHLEAAQKRAAALAEAAADAARVEREALAAVEARWKERADEALKGVEREAQALLAKALTEAAGAADLERERLVKEAVDAVAAQAKVDEEALGKRIAGAKADAARPTSAETELPLPLQEHKGKVPTPEETQTAIGRVRGTVEPILAVLPLDLAKPLAGKLPGHLGVSP